jgi:hypothetical protein
VGGAEERRRRHVRLLEEAVAAGLLMLLVAPPIPVMGCGITAAMEAVRPCHREKQGEGRERLQGRRKMRMRATREGGAC